VALASPAAAQPVFDLVFERRECPQEIDAPPGALCVAARLVTRNTVKLEEGADAWSLGISSQGCTILEATTAGTASHVDPGQVGTNAYLNLEFTSTQALLAVVRDFRQARPLPPSGSPHDLLLLVLEGRQESDCDSCVLRFVDGLRGSGRPVENWVTANLKSVKPSLGSMITPWRPPACDPPADLAAGVPRFQATLSACKESACFAFTAPPGKPVLIDLTDSRLDSRNALYLKWGEPATPTHFDQAENVPGLSGQKMVVAEARAQPGYLLVRTNGRTATSTVEVRALLADLALSRVSPVLATRDTRPTLVILGAGFQKDATHFRLRSAADENLTRDSLTPALLLPHRAEVAFDLAGLPVGAYHVEAHVPATSLQARIERAFTVRERIEKDVTATLTGHPRNGRDLLSRMTLRYENTGTDERPAPIFRIRAPDQVSLRLDRERDFQGPELLVLGIDPVGFAGRLAPGARHEVPILFQTSADFACDVLEFEVSILGADEEDAIDWAAIAPPPGVSDWGALRLRLQQHLGSTWKDYNEALAAVATRLTRRGIESASLLELTRFAARQALDRATAAAVGRVRRASSGEPLPGVRVAAQSGAAVVSSAITDSEGSFALDWLENGVHYVVRVEGYGPTAALDMPATGDSLGDLDLRVEEEAGGPAMGCTNCNEAGLPAAPIPPPANLFAPQPSWPTLVVCAIDPNTKDGPKGERPEGFPESALGGFVGRGVEPYRINFENTGTAPAQTVVITDRLAPEFDIESLSLGEVVWGGYHLTMKPTQNITGGYHDFVSQDPTVGRGRKLVQHWLEPERQLLVEVTASLFADRVIEWRFGTLDPATCKTLDPESFSDDDGCEPVARAAFDDGFLPPNDVSGMGSGYVAFTIGMVAGLPEDTPVNNDATIVFGGAHFEALTTPAYTNFFSSFGPAETPSNENPPSGVTDVPVDVALEWHPVPGSAVNAYSFSVFLWEGGPETEPTVPAGSGLRAPRFQPGNLHHETLYSWRVVARNRKNDLTRGEVWTFTTAPPSPLRRGDGNGDGQQNITDGIYVLNALFTGGPAPRCRDAADSDDNGVVNITDPIYLLNFLFAGGMRPPAPFPDCGEDPTPDALPCGEPSCP
jgi:hypothetical protein